MWLNVFFKPCCVETDIRYNWITAKVGVKHQSINVETDNMGFIYLTLINLNAMFTEIIEFL